MTLWRRLTAPFRLEPRRPLAARQPEQVKRDVPLGMEATDLDLVEATIRKNQSLERSSNIFNRNRGGFAEAADRTQRSFKDDETYAAEYHRAFGKEE